jgi:hypothetical protein
VTTGKVATSAVIVIMGVEGEIGRVLLRGIFVLEPYGQASRPTLSRHERFEIVLDRPVVVQEHDDSLEGITDKQMEEDLVVIQSLNTLPQIYTTFSVQK